MWMWMTGEQQVFSGQQFSLSTAAALNMNRFVFSLEQPSENVYHNFNKCGIYNPYFFG
jgi:hypothetical protein